MRTTQHKPALRIRHRQAGAVLLLVTFSLIAFFGFVALALDLGRMYIIKSQLQNAADSGALRAALELNGTSEGVWRAGRTGYPCTPGSGNPCGIEGALKNGYLLATQNLLANEITVRVANRPDVAEADWHDPATVTGPNDYYYVRVITSKTGIVSFFAGILGIWENAARAVAIAGRSPSGRVLPLFMPVIRRNPDQIVGTECDGYLFDPDPFPGSTNFNNPENCPPIPSNGLVGNPLITEWRSPDPYGDWGYKPVDGATRNYPGSSANYETQTDAKSHYTMIMGSGGEDPFWIFDGTSWTGNYGWVTPNGENRPQIARQLCKGTVAPPPPVPGCSLVQTGLGFGDDIRDGFDSRFDKPTESDLPGDLTYADCSPDKNIYEWTWPSAAPYPYQQYLAGSPSQTPTHSPTGAPRRNLRAFIVDNYLRPLKGWNDGVSGCYDPLIGGQQSRPAHIVGCAEFFMLSSSVKTGNSGKVYVQFVRRVPDLECRLGSGAETFNEIRLFR